MHTPKNPIVARIKMTSIMTNAPVLFSATIAKAFI
jgi:hypothetical protein